MKLYNFLLLITYILVTNLVTCEITLTPGPVTCKYKKKDFDEKFNIHSAVNIKCNGNTCSIDGSGASSSEGMIEISKSGVYIIQGSLQGQLRIKAKEFDYIHLILNNTTIESNNGPAIYGIMAYKVTLTLVGDNTLSDSTNYTDYDRKIDSCLFIENDLSINGSGSLSVTGNYKNAISCKDNLKLISGNINVPGSIQKGIKSKNSLCIKDAVINIVSKDTAINVSNNKNAEKGYAVIDGGKINIKTDFVGIHAETHLTINDGYIDIKKSEEGFESQMIDILGGEIHIFATDDGINGSKIKDFPGFPFDFGNHGEHGNPSNHTKFPPPPPPTEENSVTDGSVYINIVGGKTYITVKGEDVDGIDSNGIIFIGGKAELYINNIVGDTYGFMAALDADDVIAIDGATVITASSRPPKIPPPSNQNNTISNIHHEEGKIYQPYIRITFDEQDAGTDIILKNNENNIIASYTPINPYSILLITSPKMIAGQNYTIIAGTIIKTKIASNGIEGTFERPPSITVPLKN